MINLFIFLYVLAHAQDAVQKPIYIRDISMFRSQVVLNIYQNKSVKVGSKLLAQTPTSAHHKCLLVVTRLNGDTAYSDATQCPGYATLKKGQQVQLAMADEINEEIRFAKPKPEKSAAIKNLPAPVIPALKPTEVVAPAANAATPPPVAPQASAPAATPSKEESSKAQGPVQQ